MMLSHEVFRYPSEVDPTKLCLAWPLAISAKDTPTCATPTCCAGRGPGLLRPPYAPELCQQMVDLVRAEIPRTSRASLSRPQSQPQPSTLRCR